MNIVNGLADTEPMHDPAAARRDGPVISGTRQRAVPQEAVLETHVVDELDPVDQELADSFPASDPPSWGRLAI